MGAFSGKLLPRFISVLIIVAGWLFWCQSHGAVEILEGRSEVGGWHFRGGEDRELVEGAVRQFNEFQG